MNYVSQENLDNIVKGLSNKIAMSVSNGALIGDTTPVGTVISFMGTTAPLFYLVCDGQTYNIVEYQELADFIEAQFGTVNYFGGDGVTTFAVPDLRGEFLRGTGTNSHTLGGVGSEVGEHQAPTRIPNIGLDTTNQQAYLPNVGGVVTTSANSYVANFDARSSLTINGKDYEGTENTNGYIKFTGTYQQDMNNNALYTVRPTNTSVLYCIKYTKAVIPSEYEDGTPVGRVIFDSILREGYIKANGAQIEDASISIPRLLSFVQKYSSQLIAPDQATYDANVGLYMYDSNNDVLTLPNYIGRFLEGGNSVTSIEAGLPNITSKGGNLTASRYSSPSSSDSFGAIYTVADNYIFNITSSTSGNGNRLTYFEFDASKSNSTYSDTVTTVQPSSITLIPQIRY